MTTFALFLPLLLAIAAMFLVGALPSGFASKPKEIEFKGRTFFEVEWPVFQPCSRRNPTTGQIDVFDKQWLEQAVDAQNQHFSQTYLAPIHIGHRKPHRDDPDQAGFLGPARMGIHNGTPTMFTKAFLTPEAFEQVDTLHLPYRSVEIIDPKSPEISSLALLKTQVPFFKFGLPGLQQFSDRAAGAVLYFHAEDEYFDSRVEVVFAIDDEHPLLFEDDDDSKKKKSSSPPPAEDAPAFGGGGEEEELDEAMLEGLSEEELLALLGPGEDVDPIGSLADETAADAGGFDPDDGADGFDDSNLAPVGGGLADPGMEPVTREEFEEFARTITDQIVGMHGSAAPEPSPPVIA